MNGSDENKKRVSDRKIDENKNICRSTLVSYVIHIFYLNILFEYSTLI